MNRYVPPTCFGLISFIGCMLLTPLPAAAQVGIGPASNPASDPDQASFSYSFRNDNGNGTYTDYSGAWSPASGDYPDYKGGAGGDGYACWQYSTTQTGADFETEDGNKIAHCDFRDPGNYYFIRSAVLSWGFPINHNGGNTIFGSQVETDDYWLKRFVDDVNASWPNPLTDDPSPYKSYPSSFVYNNHGFTDAIGKVRAILTAPGCTGEAECNGASPPGDDEYMTAIPNSIFNPINLSRFTAIVIDEQEDGSVRVRDDNFFNENAEDICEPWHDQAYWGHKYIITLNPDELHYSSWLRLRFMDGPFNPVSRHYYKLNFGPIINNIPFFYAIYPSGSYEPSRHGRHRAQFYTYGSFDNPDDSSGCTFADPNW